jgi:hypothetical protein
MVGFVSIWSYMILPYGAFCFNLGLKWLKYNNKLTHVCYSHKEDNEIGYLFQWQVTFEVGTSKTSLTFTTCFILLK